MNDDKLTRRLSDLLGFACDAAFTVSLGLDAYLEDSPMGRVLRNNGRHILIEIATVVEKLPQAYKQQHEEVEWLHITKMRNLIAHYYDGVEDRLVFTALAERVPELIARLGLE